MVINSGDTDKKLYALLSLVRTVDILDRYMEVELGKHGSSPIRFGLMNAIITHNGRMTPTALSKWMFRTKHAVTSLLRTLEAQGLIQREANVQDGRSTYIRLTKEGRKAVRKMIPSAQEMTETVFSCLDDEQIDTLNIILRRLRKHLLTQMLPQR